jgi:plastocyanin
MIRLHKYTHSVQHFYMERINLLIVATISAILTIGITCYSQTGMVFAQTQPNLNATSVYDSGRMILGNNVKHLVVVIPNEGHHGPGEEDESRFIAQPFVPQNVVIEPGTQVAWFNGDVGHEHNIVVNDPNRIQVFDTGEFTELSASRPVVFNDTGDYEYADTIEYEGGFVMTGTITVANETTTTPSPSPATYDTVGALMVPSMDVQNIAATIKDAGFGIDSMQNFKDLRGGQSDTGDEQTLVIWTANGMDLNEVASKLQAISEPLPYE